MGGSLGEDFGLEYVMRSLAESSTRAALWDGSELCSFSSSDFSLGHIYFLASCLCWCELLEGIGREGEIHRMGSSQFAIFSVEDRIKAAVMRQELSGPAASWSVEAPGSRRLSWGG